MQENEKTTVPIPSVGADGEQSLSYVTNEIITTGNEEINPIDESMEEMLRQMQRMSDPSYLATMTMSQLYDTVYESRLPVIDGLLYPGTYLFVGDPKVGKSFLMAQIAYHVSTGLPLWNYSIHAGTVLYLALEDDYRRLQERLYRMFGVDGTDTLHFATCAKQLGAGLYEQLARFVSEHRDTRLIIIDTLQKIREASGDRYSYASDYEIIGQLKHFADQTGIALLLVHHTRKQQADDKFDMISGTNGLLGAADGAFVLQKEKRTGNTAVLEVSGRDQPEQRLILKKDMEMLDHVQAEMSTARQFLFILRCKGMKPEQIFQTANRTEKVISEQGFEVRRMKKADIKRFLAIYFGASMNGDQMPDVDGEQFYEVEDDEEEN